MTPRQTVPAACACGLLATRAGAVVLPEATALQKKAIRHPDLLIPSSPQPLADLPELASRLEGELADMRIAPAHGFYDARAGRGQTLILSEPLGPGLSTGVTLTDTLPGDVAFASSTPGVPSCIHASGTVTCNLGALAAGGDDLLLTSHEGTEKTRDAHSGHLFRVPAAVLLGEAPPARVSLGAPLRAFRAKPEGLAIEPSGALVVVFDDDRKWKRLFAGYEQSDGLFTVIDPQP